MKVWTCIMVVLLSFISSSCTSPADTEGPVNAGPREGYPTGPYGVVAESTMENLSFTRLQGGPLQLQDIYGDGQNHLLLISTAAGWCTACVEEQPKLQELHERFGPRGLVVMLSYFEDSDYNAAEIAKAQEWKDRYGLTFTVVADPNKLLGAYYDVDLTPMNMIVDVSSMQIVWLTTGWDQSTIEALIQSKL